jgi:hypothetical protein
MNYKEKYIKYKKKYVDFKLTGGDFYSSNKNQS